MIIAYFVNRNVFICSCQHIYEMLITHKCNIYQSEFALPLTNQIKRSGDEMCVCRSALIKNEGCA